MRDDTRRIGNRDNPFSMHFQKVWLERAANTRLPLWARLVSLAYGNHEANGHANFKRGDLGFVLGTPPRDGEPPIMVSKYALRDALNLAIEIGWLDPRSCTECLVVPAHAITGGLGDPEKPCVVHERKRTNRAKKTVRPQLRVVGE